MMDDISSADTRALYTAFVAVFALHRVWLWMRSRKARAHRSEHGHRELGARYRAWLPAIWGTWLGGCLLEVWVFSVGLPSPLFGLGLVLLALAWGIRVERMRQLQNRWTFAVMQPSPDPEGLLAGFQHPELMAMRAEIVGVPLLHGAAVSALLGWVLLLKYSRSIEKALEPDSG